MNKQGIKIKGVLVNQFTSKPIAISAIPFLILRDMVKFTSREHQNYDPFNPDQTIGEVMETVNDSYYQRLLNDKRVNQIYEFLLKEIDNLHSSKNNALGTFPTSVIVSLDLNEYFETKEEYVNYLEKIGSSEYIGAFFEKVDEEKIELLIPQRKVSLIVDGQHRLAGMIKLYNDALNNSIKVGRKRLEEVFPNLSNEIVLKSIKKFEFNCTVLLGYDKWEQGKVFANVNFNQKPVNKSLYYDIFGSFPDPDKNEIFLAHMLALHLNNNKDSVLKGFIKMLGSGKGFFSQAFFVEAILEHFSPKGIWASLPMDFLKDGTEYKVLPKFFKAYFRAVKAIFPEYWPKQEGESSKGYQDILCKTTGMGALIKLIDPIYRNLKVQQVGFKNETEEELTNMLKEEFSKIRNKGEAFFSKESEFAGSAGLGLQNKLFKALAGELGYRKRELPS